jgi:hypothetical protein
VEDATSRVQTITVRLITDKPVKKTPYQVKGVFMKQYSDSLIVPLLDGRYREKFLYPRVQVKILNEQIYLIGINEGVGPIKDLTGQIDFLDFGNITFNVLDMDLEEYSDRFQATTQLIRYRFITPWVALNQTTGNRYKFLKNDDRQAFLNRLLGQNIVFLAREMGITMEEKIFTKANLTSLFPKPVDENDWGAFFGEFRTNFILPNFIGLGNGITRGYGAIYGLFNPDMFQYDETMLAEDAPKTSPEKIKDEDEELEVIKVEEVPKPNKRALKKPEKKSSRRVLSEEFDIEEMPAARKPRKPKKSVKKKNSVENLPEDDRFNREEFHKKQHDI